MSGHDQPEQAVTFKRNGRSRWAGICIQIEAARDFQRYLGSNRLVRSMSAVGHCGDNAASEGLFGMLKGERIHHRRYRTQNEARADVFDYIERFHSPRMRRRVADQNRKLSVDFPRYA